MDMTRIFRTESGVPPHTPATLVEIDLVWPDISHLLAQHHALHASGVLEMSDADPVSLTINEVPCRLTGTVLGEWYLVETVDHPERYVPKGFYLLPGSEILLANNDGKIPYFEFPDHGFDELHADSAAGERRIYLYALYILEYVIHDVTPDHALAQAAVNSSDD